jgi:L-lactate dehydrogenase complex protein LldF
VKIDLHHELLVWRSRLAERKLLPWKKRFGMKIASQVLRRTWLYRLAGSVARRLLRWSPRFAIYNPLNAWGKQRELPKPPRHSFRELYRRRLTDQKGDPNRDPKRQPQAPPPAEAAHER